MAEANAKCAAEGRPPMYVVSRVTVKPLTEAEEKAYDDAQAAAKAAKAEKKAEKKGH